MHTHTHRHTHSHTPTRPHRRTRAHTHTHTHTKHTHTAQTRRMHIKLLQMKRPQREMYTEVNMTYGTKCRNIYIHTIWRERQSIKLTVTILNHLCCTKHTKQEREREREREVSGERGGGWNKRTKRCKNKTFHITITTSFLLQHKCSAFPMATLRKLTSKQRLHHFLVSWWATTTKGRLKAEPKKMQKYTVSKNLLLIPKGRFWNKQFRQGVRRNYLVSQNVPVHVHKQTRAHTHTHTHTHTLSLPSPLSLRLLDKHTDNTYCTTHTRTEGC